MDEVILPNGRATSRIGYGCGSLRGGGESAASRALVSAALDAGIRHFDLAPSYGLGLAEDIAGQALADLHGDVTITTKAGIGRPGVPGLLTGIRTVAKPVIGRFPGVWGAAASRVRMAASSRGRFGAGFIRASLAQSLKRLRRDRVDILLMHEMRACDISDELVSVLNELRQGGAVGALGCGGDREEGRLIAAQCPQLGQVRQFQWCVFDAPIEDDPAGFCITHGAVSAGRHLMAALVEKHPELAMAWSTQLDADVGNPRELADLLIAAAVGANQRGIVVVASLNPRHIRRAAEVARDPALLAKGARLSSLVRHRLSVSAGATAQLGGTVLESGGEP